MKDIKFELSRLKNYDEETLLDEIKRVSKLIISDVISSNEFDKYSKTTSGTIRRKFGSWESALKKAGLGDRYSGINISKKQREQRNRGISDQELIDELHRVIEIIKDDYLTKKTFNQHGNVSADTIQRRFGSWNKALELAEIEIPKGSKRYRDEDYWQNLLAVWTHLGRQPTYGEMSYEPSAIKANSYEQRWGTWRKALLAFIDCVEKDTDNTAPNQSSSTIQSEEKKAQKSVVVKKKKPEDRRQIPVGLRFKVMHRDDFKCVLCGNNPPASPGLILHIDHIMPWSKGGKTEIDNLRTLCADCNIGRGNRYVD